MRESVSVHACVWVALRWCSPRRRQRRRWSDRLPVLCCRRQRRCCCWLRAALRYSVLVTWFSGFCFCFRERAEAMISRQMRGTGKDKYNCVCSNVCVHACKCVWGKVYIHLHIESAWLGDLIQRRCLMTVSLLSWVCVCLRVCVRVCVRVCICVLVIVHSYWFRISTMRVKNVWNYIVRRLKLSKVNNIMEIQGVAKVKT